MPLTGTDMAQVASEFVSALNDADWDRVRALIAPDLSYAENTTGRRAESDITICDLTGTGAQDTAIATHALAAARRAGAGAVIQA